MQTSGLTAFERRLHEIADEYRRRGYRVIVGPSARQLPAFLKDYAPDLVAEGPDDSVVVEFKSQAENSRTDNWADLARTLQQHPGWRLELVVDDSLRREPPATIGRPEIERRLQDGLQLMETNVLDASLLLTWSAVEAAMRLACVKHRIDLPDLRPATVITRLYTDGIIDREDYDLLMHNMRMRNAIAHGFSQDEIDTRSILELRRLALRLLPTS